MTNKETAKLFASCIENSKYGINLVQDGDSVTIYSNNQNLKNATIHFGEFTISYDANGVVDYQIESEYISMELPKKSNK